MSWMQIQTADQRTTFRPGQEVTGVVSWDLDDSPTAVELHLQWSTRGKGTVDTQIVQTLRFDSPPAKDTRPFTLPLPLTPYSFSGRLLSLVWSLKLVAMPHGETAELPLVVSPVEREIDLYARP